MIVRLSPPYFRAVSEAHVALDPTAFLSQVPEVGVSFREKLFYPALEEDPRSFVWIYLVPGALAGFITGTQDVREFYHRLKWKKPVLLAWHLVKASLKKPPLLVQYLQSMVRLEQKHFREPGIQSEILSFGVLPEYRSAEFKRRTGAYIAETLFAKAKETFRQGGVREFKVLTLKDNVAANRFYEKQGCRVTGVAEPFDSPCNVFVGAV